MSDIDRVIKDEVLRQHTRSGYEDGKSGGRYNPPGFSGDDEYRAYSDGHYEGEQVGSHYDSKLLQQYLAKTNPPKVRWIAAAVSFICWLIIGNAGTVISVLGLIFGLIITIGSCALFIYTFMLAMNYIFFDG